MIARGSWLVTFGIVAASAAAFVWGSCQTTCASSTDCGSGQFCSMATGVCATPVGLGFCRTAEDTCAFSEGLTQPVCGCDGKTYANACEAAKALQSLLSTGACTDVCGGTTGIACGEGTYCSYAVGVCGLDAQTGTCAPIPAVAACDEVIPSPVCGCDGKTYANGCLAAAAGVSLQSNAACGCGGVNHTQCEEGTSCRFPVPVPSCNNPTGTCEPDTTCITTMPGPVCGCDLQTYPNDCEAAALGIAVQAGGGCPCYTNADCQQQGYYCYLPSGQCMVPGPAPQGTCTQMPSVCPPVVSRVCGCDGITYDSGCEAAKAGVAVAVVQPCQAGTGGGGGGG